MITDNLSGVVCGNSDILLDQLIQKGVDNLISLCKRVILRDGPFCCKI